MAIMNDQQISANQLMDYIEMQTRYLVVQLHRAVDMLMYGKPVAPTGQEPVLPLTTERLRLFTKAWAPLIPENPDIRAELLHLMGQRFPQVKMVLPAVSTALGFNTDAVAQAYQKRFEV